MISQSYDQHYQVAWTPDDAAADSLLAKQKG